MTEFREKTVLFQNERACRNSCLEINAKINIGHTLKRCGSIEEIEEGRKKF